MHRPLAGQDQAGHASRTASSPASTGSPRWCAAAGNPDITDELLKGVKLGERTYKNHLDGYNQMDLLTGKGPSKRHELFYFGGPHLGAVRIDDFKYQFYQQPHGLARPEGHDRHAHHRQPPPGSVRAHPVHRRQSLERPGRRLHERLLRPRVLAVRRSSSSGWRSSP